MKKNLSFGGEDHGGKKLRTHPVINNPPITLGGRAPWEVESMMYMVVMVSAIRMVVRVRGSVDDGLALMPRCHPRYFRCRCVIGGIGVVFVLDDDDDGDDENSDGVSGGDGDDGGAPHGKSRFFQDRGLGSGRSRSSFVCCCRCRCSCCCCCFVVVVVGVVGRGRRQ
jgi:hypothetical protein